MLPFLCFGNLQFVLYVCLYVSASEWQELSLASSKKRRMEDSMFRRLEQLAGPLCLQAAGILWVWATTQHIFFIICLCLHKHIY